MKITSITPLQPGMVTLKARNTKNNRNVQQIMDHLNSYKGENDLVIAGDDIKQFERYALQKALQKAGAHITVHSGENAQKKPVLIIKRYNDKAWKDYITNV
jgi:hypothetical protein